MKIQNTAIAYLLLLNSFCMAQKITTPGVYVQEIPSGIQSVKEVKTDVPAFIGYTELADPGFFIPTKISSLADFERKFGAGSSDANYVLYPSLKLYFINGGSACYIVSAGKYKELRKNDLIKGIAAVGKIDEVTLLVFPDAVNLAGTDLYAIQKEALLQAATLKDRFCILDIKSSATAADHAAKVSEFRNNIGSNNLKYGAVYTPFVKTDATTALPPSAIVAAQYCTVDKTKGVWKAPANIAIKGISDIAYTITETEQSGLNVDPVAGKSINAIRRFSGKGILTWGSRTLAGNDNEWRYVNVRRFFTMVEESITKSAQPFVFEPNDANTWVRIKAMIENYLTQK